MAEGSSSRALDWLPLRRPSRVEPSYTQQGFSVHKSLLSDSSAFKSSNSSNEDHQIRSNGTMTTSISTTLTARLDSFNQITAYLSHQDRNHDNTSKRCCTCKIIGCQLFSQQIPPLRQTMISRAIRSPVAPRLFALIATRLAFYLFTP